MWEFLSTYLELNEKKGVLEYPLDGFYEIGFCKQEHGLNNLNNKGEESFVMLPVGRNFGGITFKML